MVADGVVVVDEAGNVVMMNAAAEQIYNVKLTESVGKPLWQNVREEQMVALAKDMTVPSDKPFVKEINLPSARKTCRRRCARVPR